MALPPDPGRGGAVVTKPTAINISDRVLESAANLIQGAMDSMPIKDEIEWNGLDLQEADALEAILDEVTHNDLRFMAKAVARRASGQAEADGVSVVWS